MKIHGISAREIIDSRGNPTVATTVELEDGTVCEASVPSGASTGQDEAFELRDGTKSRFAGKGVLSAVSNVNLVIASALIGKDAASQEEIDNILIDLDGTQNKGNLGANALLSVSLATAKAEAISEGLELFEYLAKIFYGSDQTRFSLPTPMFNILNGGSHAKNNVDIQETMIVPLDFETFEEKLRAGVEIYHVLKSELSAKGLSIGLGDEGGFAPDLPDNESVFEWAQKAILLAKYTKSKVRLSTDVAATEFYDSKKKIYELTGDKKSLDSQGMIEILSSWAKKYNLYSVEDGLSENDPFWGEMTKNLSGIITVGDDFLTTNPEKIKTAGEGNLANGVIIKPNQIGTLTETFEAIREAKNANMKVIVSHRSGETEDSFISDLAVGVGADLIKSGAPARSERLAKYNRLTKIEDIIRQSYEDS